MLKKLLFWLWVLPCTGVGVLLGSFMLLGRGRWRIRQGAIEFALRPNKHQIPRWIEQHIAFSGITLGYCILGQSFDLLDSVTEHERVHVRQYERWGMFFLILYPLASIWAVLRGRHYYYGNQFEIEAYGEDRTDLA